jgi:phage-related protein
VRDTPRTVPLQGIGTLDAHGEPAAEIIDGKLERLHQVQRGDEPDDWKPIRTVGQSVREIRIHEESGAFRVIYLATRPEGVYVLHCFQKRTQKTSRRDLRLAVLRFAAIVRRGER